MQIEISKLALAEQAEYVYELYRLCDEPDSPQTAFKDLNPEQRDAVFERAKQMNFMIKADGKLIGFGTMVPHLDGYNVGSAIHPKFQNQGYGKKVLKVAMEILAEELPDNNFYCASRKLNQPAIKVMERFGLEYVREEVRPPLGRFKEDIVYVVYKFTT